MKRLLTLAMVAHALGYQPSYVRRIAADQMRPLKEQRYSETIHENFPQFFRYEGRKGYVVPQHTFEKFMRRLGLELEAPL